ncbi:MAG: D-methionine transport system ATP-binding protein [Halanaerobiales bacterium]|nr:D-methionine transport system ATP-binding protein [Halanaerobiales bacterium]
MIEIKNLVKKYKTRQEEITALNNINLKINEGEIFGIIGPSGAGKSTLIRTVNLLEKPSSGEILINGENITSLAPDLLRKRRQKIGMIFQHFNLLNSRTVRGNVSFPLEIAGVAKAEREKRVDRLIELVGLADRADHYPAQLSGGQKQRVGIARALANEPELLLSDEATSSLDPESTGSILELLARIRDEMKLTILLITHEMEVIKQVCDRVAVMEKGRIIEEGKVIDLFANPRQSLTRRFIKSIIDFNFPEELFKDHNGGELIRVSFLGKSTHQPLISSLVKTFELDANILYGKIDDIQGIPFGTLILELEGEYNQVLKGINYLKGKGLTVEVLSDDGALDQAVQV